MVVWGVGAREKKKMPQHEAIHSHHFDERTRLVNGFNVDRGISRFAFQLQTIDIVAVTRYTMKISAYKLTIILLVARKKQRRVQYTPEHARQCLLLESEEEMRGPGPALVKEQRQFDIRKKQTQHPQKNHRLIVCNWQVLQIRMQ